MVARGCGPNDPVWISLRLNLGYALKFAEGLNLAAMTPRGDLASTGYCLANASAASGEYLVYLPFGGSVAVNLSATSGTLNSEWFNPSNGLTVSGVTVPGGGSRSFLAPFSGNAVLYIYQDSIDRRNEHIPPERGRTR